MAWFSLLPASLAVLETWMIRIFVSILSPFLLEPSVELQLELTYPTSPR